MKKATNNKPKANIVKGNLKISSFFTKQIEPKSVCAVDSDDEFVVSKPSVKLKSNQTPTKINNKSTNNEGHTTNNKNDVIAGPDSPNSRKRKLTSGSSKEELGPAKKKVLTSELSNDIKPSTCEQMTPTKRMLSVKTPEKLLTPSALREYHTPDKNPFKKTPVKSPAAKKLVFNPDDYIVKKNSPTPTKKSNEKTPLKGKRTPKKLYETSPKNLQDFNVQVIENFVKITPSKSSTKRPEVEVIFKSSEKKQCSILNYMSPRDSKSMLIQSNNEKTPVKQSPQKANLEESVNKARTRLDFKASPAKLGQCSRIENGTEEDFSDAFGDDDDSMWGNLDDINYSLNLQDSQHCKIVTVERYPVKTVITLKATNGGEMGKCTLQGFWMHTQLQENDTVHIIAQKVENEWIVNNDFGLLVFEPDDLISSTSVVNTIFCKRKSVLSERFHSFEPTNHHMIIGTIVHDLLQTVLANKCRSHGEVEKIAHNLIREEKTISRLYECDMSIEQMEVEIHKFVPQIIQFIETYVKSNSITSKGKKNYKKDDWKGTITSVADIEENVWCPELGIKGKIDVTVETDSTHMMPLELKTGRATVSLEHRGQVILYIMMMNKLGYNVPSGLLLYLREGVLREIPMTHKEKRDIIMMRNDLTYYLRNRPKMDKDSETSQLTVKPPELPEPINHRACDKCPYNIVCASYLRYNKEPCSNTALKKIQEESLAHISDAHLDYIMHWHSMLAIESNSEKGNKNIKEIFTVKPEKRESDGKCIINLRLVDVGDPVNGLYMHTFEKNDPSQSINFLASGLCENKYVVISTDTRPAVSAGLVTSIDATSLVVHLDRDLSIKHPNKIFHVDTYDSNTIQSFNMTSLSLLLELTPRGEQLRQCIIDRKVPTFENKLPRIIATKGTPILKRLNRVQQRAVLKAIAANDYLLINGMPGTGKTTTIVALIQLLTELGKSVIITSHTHSAVDNVCLKLLTFGVKFMRLGSASRIHPKLKSYSEHALTKHCTTPEELKAVYNNQLVLAVTCLGSGHPVLSKRTLDVCIVDESTQVLQSSVIRPIYAAKKFILIGDPDQLPAVVKNTDAIKLGMTESIFDRLNCEAATIALNLNFRMNKTITALANDLTYNGELLIGSDEVADATLQLPQKNAILDIYKSETWILDALDDTLAKAVQFLDTGAVWKLNHSVPWYKPPQNGDYDCVNIYEAATVVKLVNAMLKGGVPSGHIGVIATYRAQVAQISALLEITKVDVSTVDQFQGKDKKIIIYSCTKSKDNTNTKGNKEFEILEDKKRLNVAITRAKNKLLFVGDLNTLQEYSTFKKLLPSLANHIIRLNDYKDFQWDSILNT
ncbi:DNA replication ATP-dependent helicase/nuclease DNA2 isoform X2 [Aethina tumida]|uniref:DNA replication ATP-dependent helicase/nuclease DNA2 isoform X2 n=1 Tax=Aethina tumida TaxID=116153 RepID=UPI0021479A05|nr:DNA replication ATP-dependent helicase/nuclease DNA2 isoform X2 [Aethina tumida]